MGPYVIEYYKLGLFSEYEMAGFVQAGWITQEEYDKVKAEMGR